MKSDEFRSLQAALQLKNRDIEQWFGVSDQTVVNWRHGYSRIPESVAILMRREALEQRSTTS